jgi:FAD/FMN-containing dehydrogenase/Fe-S oxidoreductase
MKLEFTHEMKFELERQIQGEVRIDPVSRLVYSTDASIYQIEPLGVAIPRESDDLIAIVEYAAKNRVPVLPRGSGSSLAGQTVGRALVMDNSKYLDKILEINPDEKTAWVEPGVVLSAFNTRARNYGLQFGPDPASGERATFGGMIGNNSTGAHSILFGMTSDHLLELNVVLADGAIAKFKPIDLDQAVVRSGGNGIESHLYHSALKIQEKYSEAIKKRWPRTWRNASGYALNYLLPWSASTPPAWSLGSYPPIEDGVINLASLMAGSEGTLGVFARAKVRLVEIPKNKVLMILAYDSLIEAVEATPPLLEHDPSAVELVPQAILTRARRIPAYASRLEFLEGDPAALLLVEFAGDDKNQLVDSAKRLSSSGFFLEDEHQQKQLWEVRKVGLGLLMSVVGDTKPIPFIEDIAVPVNDLGVFVREFLRIMEAYGTKGDFYAHSSAGCLHIRPWINLKRIDGIEAMKGITSELVALAVKLGGALSGEHGDGLARASWLEKIYGQELLQAFRELKQAADPQNIMNPGKVIDPPPMDENLRYGIGYDTKIWESELDFSSQENLAGAVEMCNGAGVCRKMDPGMCPTFQATREEMHSTRGRANLLRAMISGRYPPDMAPKQAAFEALELCLACKACKAECPSGVDMAKLKYAFLEEYYRENPRSLRDYLFAYIGELAQLARIFRVILNPLLASGMGKAILSGLGVARQRDFPLLVKNGVRAELLTSGERVILISDPYTEYFTPELEMQALEVLKGAGCQVIKLRQIGTGRTKLSKGFLQGAKQDAEKLLAELKQIDPQGKLPVVGIEPSEVATLTDDLLSLFPGDAFTEALARRAYSVEEFLLRAGEDGNPRFERLRAGSKKEQILLHGHCYQKTQKPADDGQPVGVEASKALFEEFGCEVEVIEAGCCGMAGAFGYEEEHYQVSMQVGELALFPAVREKQPRHVLAAPGASCRTQIASGTGEEALHPVTLLYEMLKKR